MAEPGIVFDHVWKKFRRGELHDSLRDLIPALAKRMISGAPRVDQLQQREFWALSDLSFDVRPGEALGIIGANGAGKSTTLKILNRILRPTIGRYEVRGRAGSLIEVSAGFHQDLTGRENVYLQGAIMGMRKVEIDRKFEEIVEFSGIGEFIDTPVKRYSSGMNARLGFSIAAHLDPDVLIIDEVLAVGDLSFQDRAFGRIKSMVKSGIPVVIVSHQLDRIAQLCTKCIVLERGRMVRSGLPGECIADYVLGNANTAERLANLPVRLEEMEMLTSSTVRSGDRVAFRLRGTVDEGTDAVFDPFNIRVIATETGHLVYATLGKNHGLTCPQPGSFEVEVSLQLNVPPGLYHLETVVHDLRHNGDAGVGPSTYLQVVDERGFRGGVQMNATMQLAPAVAASR
jgi:ABC-type polysaccharide/polyol phosphate transport system ATPase subunit